MSHMPHMQQLVEAWVHVSPNRAFMSRDTEDGAATAGANLIGDDTTDPAATGKDIYTESNNLPTAVASILNHTQNRADFHPAAETAEELARHFDTYIEEIDKTPFLTLLTHERQRQEFYSKDYNALIDQVVSLYDGVAEEDKNAIKESIADMAKSVFGEKKSNVWKNLFSQSTLDFTNPDNPRIFIYYTSLHMVHNDSGKEEVSEQEYEVRVTSYGILPDLIKAHADTLAGLEQKSVDDWARDSTSPEKEDARPCFRARPLKKAS